jgi:hypothetical protein
MGQTSRPGFRAQRQWRLTPLSVKNVRRLTMRGQEIAKADDREHRVTFVTRQPPLSPTSQMG